MSFKLAQAAQYYEQQSPGLGDRFLDEVTVPMTLVQLLADLASVEFVLRREDEVLAVAVVATPAGRRVLALERTYRDGIHVLLDPTEEEIEIARSGDLWKLWSFCKGLNPHRTHPGLARGFVQADVYLKSSRNR
ncbi:MAG TPA: hypothetical protein VIA62_15205 [Thermoanaerobaculia bacterium]|nr:hypothetical protein [Thermoanaerobaculia bacterium]